MTSTTTEMPNTGERWFKAMNLKILRVIQRYFTCEGRFNIIYHCHIILLFHFIGKDIMNIPFYLFRSIGKMANRV